MTENIKLLWVGDAVAQTGFARVTHSVLDNLATSETYDINVLGVNHRGDPHDYDYKIWPAGLAGDVLGRNRLAPLIKLVKPDVVVLFNDIWVVNEYLKVLEENEYTGKTVVYFPVDSSGYVEDFVKPLYLADKVLVYTQWGYDTIRAAEFKGDISIVPHGTNREMFFPIEQNKARAELMNLSNEDFIVFNGNRNQPRKRIDLTIKGFCKFAADKPNARLYLHTGLKDVGWPIIPLMQRECKKYGLKDMEYRLIITHPDLSPNNSVPVESLNVIYNTADVGINTSLGEGWGLVSFEQSACGVPQIVPDFSATQELYGNDRGLLLPVERTLTNTSINTEGGLVHEDDVTDLLNKYYYDEELWLQHAAKMFNFISDDRFDWKNIAKIWDRHIRDTL